MGNSKLFFLRLVFEEERALGAAGGGQLGHGSSQRRAAYDRCARANCGQRPARAARCRRRSERVVAGRAMARLVGRADRSRRVGRRRLPHDNAEFASVAVQDTIR